MDTNPGPKLLLQTFFRNKIIHAAIYVDALHLSIPAQGLPNGEAALPHAAYPGIQPYPGVGKFYHIVEMIHVQNIAT